MKFYKREIAEVFDELKSSSEGLSDIESKKRLEEYGENALNVEVKISALKIFIEQFCDFITYILIFAVVVSLISGYFYDSSHYIDAIIIGIILIVNATIGFFQEYSAQRSLEALKKLNKIQAKVLRKGKFIMIDSKFLVPGDIIFLESGDKVPADARIIEERRLRVEESALTGESIPVQKHIATIKDDVQIGDQKNMLFSSTSIAEGSAKAIITSTGMSTEIGKITEMITHTEQEMTPLQIRLDSFGRKLSLVIIAICAFVFLALIIKEGISQENLISFFLIAISLAVAAVPTALPAVVTVALSIGVKRLLHKKALVRRLSSVESLGSCDIICTDKTGTLTKNEMTVENTWTLASEAKISGVGYNPHGKIEGKTDKLLFVIGIACNNSSVYKQKGIWTISGDPTEAALIVSANKANVKQNFERLDEIPFDSNRKMMSVLVKDKEDLFVYSKGSATHIIHKCTHALLDGKVIKLTDDIKKQIFTKNDDYSSKALRVLAFAYKNISHKKDFTEEKLTFVGLQAMIDPPRPDVIESIQKTKVAGIRVIMITGDYRETAKAIGEKVGITGNILTGADIEEMTDEQLAYALNNDTNIFARVIPEHKYKIVSILQSQGHIVAMTGDGVNDAPALKKADIGVAVGSGTDVAKEASDFVLLDDSFSHIVNAIEEGRGIYDNIQKSIMLLLSGNFGEVLIIFLSVLFGFNLPLTAILLLWINMVTDGAPALAFSVDPYGRNIMTRKPINVQEGILPKSKLYLIGILGFTGTIIGLFIFNKYGGNLAGQSSIIAQTMIFNFVVLYEILLVFIIRKQYNIKQFSNWWVWSSVVLCVLLQAMIMYTPLANIFKVAPLGISEILALAMGGVVFYLIYIVYYIVNRGLRKTSDFMG